MIRTHECAGRNCTDHGSVPKPTSMVYAYPATDGTKPTTPAMTIGLREWSLAKAEMEAADKGPPAEPKFSRIELKSKTVSVPVRKLTV